MDSQMYPDQDMNKKPQQLEQLVNQQAEQIQTLSDSLSQLIKVKTFTGMTTSNGILYTSLNSSKCVVVSASSSKLINGEAVLCAPLVNEGIYGIGCRSATYPHRDFNSMELSITVYYIELIA